ncbi:hypothetical protein [Saccharothrix hoggarensis]|uniref:Uncharacterized protein n=1 Tax=Saccharothrix hoggarensis TaxID=913853 RepID=A0ABW3QZR6_9PSEU
MKGLLAVVLVLMGGTFFLLVDHPGSLHGSLIAVAAGLLLLAEIGFGYGPAGVGWLTCAVLGFWKGQDVATWAGQHRLAVVVVIFVLLVALGSRAAWAAQRAEWERAVRDRHG